MKGTALSRFTFWLAVVCWLVFAVVEAGYRDVNDQSVGVLLSRIFFWNLCFLILGVSIYRQPEPTRIYRIMRLITLMFLILLSGICHYFLVANGSQTVEVLFTMFVFVSCLTVLSLELVAWRASRRTMKG